MPSGNLISCGKVQHSPQPRLCAAFACRLLQITIGLGLSHKVSPLLCYQRTVLVIPGNEWTHFVLSCDASDTHTHISIHTQPLTHIVIHTQTHAPFPTPAVFPWLTWFHRPLVFPCFCVVETMRSEVNYCLFSFSLPFSISFPFSSPSFSFPLPPSPSTSIPLYPSPLSSSFLPCAFSLLSFPFLLISLYLSFYFLPSRSNSLTLPLSFTPPCNFSPFSLSLPPFSPPGAFRRSVASHDRPSARFPEMRARTYAL